MVRATVVPTGTPFGDMTNACRQFRTNGKALGAGITQEQMGRLEQDPTLYGLTYLIRAAQDHHDNDYATPLLIQHDSLTSTRIKNAVARAAQENRLK
jgi:hypothetical protein